MKRFLLAIIFVVFVLIGSGIISFGLADMELLGYYKTTDGSEIIIGKDLIGDIPGIGKSCLYRVKKGCHVIYINCKKYGVKELSVCWYLLVNDNLSITGEDEICRSFGDLKKTSGLFGN